jgi:hypothetical protein
MRSQNRWLILMLVFGIGPLIVYWTLIHPSVLRISGYQGRVSLQAAAQSLINFGPGRATGQELEQLGKIKQSQLARVKKINSRESLLHFSGTLADALALQARLRGLRIISVDLQNALIKGRYVPENDRALDMLAALPSPKWNELADPLDLPMLHLPSVEIQMTVSAEYSQVFSFIESLPDFPVQVGLASLDVADDPGERVFRLKIRGYYFGNERIQQLARAEKVASN